MRPPEVSVWPPLPPRAWLARPARRLPFPLEEEECTLYARARHGLWQGVRALGLGPGDEVLMPAYHHGSEVEALVRAGLRPRFYDCDDALEPDEAALAAAAGPRTRALHLVHYLGFPQNVRRWRAWCDARGLLLLEDAAQAWLAREPGGPVGSLGDLAVFCLYKTVGLPDGAALRVRPAPPAPDTAGAPGAAALARTHAAWLAGRSGLAARLSRPGARRARAYDAAADFALGDPSTPAAPLSRLLLPRVADEAAADLRREHYRFLLERLGGRAAPGFDRLPDGAAPFAFPIEVPDKAAELARLARAGVRALDFWAVPHPALPAGEYPAAARRRARTLGLPVHQELRRADLERITRAAG